MRAGDGWICYSDIPGHEKNKMTKGKTMQNPRLLCLTDRSDLPETELFCGLKHEGVDIEVACNPTGKHIHRLHEAGIKTFDLQLKSRLSPKGIKLIKKILSTKNYDILYCFNNHATANTLLATSKKDNYKIITYRGIVGNLSFYSPASWLTHLNPRVDRIVCVAEAVRKYILSLRFFNKSLHPGRVVTIYKGHRIEWYQQPPCDIHKEFSIPENAFTVGFAGRNRPRKGIDDIIEAASLLPGEPKICFILMGNMDKDKRLINKMKKFNNKNRIILAGYRNDAPAVSAACDAFILPSREREGLARAVIEAMACGTPPIVTSIGGLPELVSHMKSGIVIPPCSPDAIASAVLKLAKDPALTKRLGENAKKRIKTDFNIESTIRNTIELLESLNEPAQTVPRWICC